MLEEIQAMVHSPDNKIIAGMLYGDTFVLFILLNLL